MFIVVLCRKLFCFACILVNAVYLQATKEHNRYAAARNKTGNKN